MSVFFPQRDAGIFEIALYWYKRPAGIKYKTIHAKHMTGKRQ